MYTSFRIESTQVRGRRIEETMKSIAWDDIPEDGLILKEYETPTYQDDCIPLHKPNIKNTLKEFWELREETCEDEISKSQKSREEKASQDKKSDLTVPYMSPQDYEEMIKSTPNQKPSRRSSKIHRISGEKESYKKDSEHTDSGKRSNSHKSERQQKKSAPKPQPTEYMVKLAKALEESKGNKGKYNKVSQKLSFPTSSSLSMLMGKRTKVNNLTQIVPGSDIKEDIEDWECVDHGGVYIATKGQKKIKLDFSVKMEPESRDFIASAPTRNVKGFNTQSPNGTMSKTPERLFKKIIIKKPEFQTDVKTSESTPKNPTQH